jgi:hypothetical protein
MHQYNIENLALAQQAFNNSENLQSSVPCFVRRVARLLRLKVNAPDPVNTVRIWAADKC